MVVTVVRYGPIVFSVPGSSDGNQLSVVTWNVLAGQADGMRVRNGLMSIDADLVGLQELQPEAAEMLATDPTLSARYPYRALEPDYSVYGIGLLSKHPIVDYESSSDPPYLVAHVAPAGAIRSRSSSLHPLPARIRAPAGIPVSLDATKRDAGHRLDPLADRPRDRARPAGRGDGRLQRDRARARLPRPEQRACATRISTRASGSGLTWRPGALRSLPFGLLRIDYILTTTDLEAVSTHVECSGNSDHCLLAADLVSR